MAEAADAAYRSGDAIPEAVDFNPDSPVTELFTKNAGASLQGTGVSRGQYGEHWYHAPAPIRLSPERSPSPIYLGESAATFGHTAAFHFETAGAAPQTGVDTNQTPVQRGPNMSPVRSVKAGASQFGAVVNPLLSGVPGLDSGGPFALQVQTAIQTACNKYAESARVQAAIQGCNLAAILAAVAAEEDLNKDPSRVKRAARAVSRSCWHGRGCVTCLGRQSGPGVGRLTRRNSAGTTEPIWLIFMAR